MRIKYGAFSGCISLFFVVIGYSVEQIQNNAFYNCISLESIAIPKSVTEIGYEAFQKCSKLETVIFNDPVGWYCRDYRSIKKNFTSTELSNSVTAAKYLVNTCSALKWYKG